jgi:hypothetical protein
MQSGLVGGGLEIDVGGTMVEDDAALHRCVNSFVEHAENLQADGYTLNFIVQALQGALAKLSASEEEATVITLPKSE